MWSIYAFCTRNRNYGLGYILHIGILGPLGNLCLWPGHVVLVLTSCARVSSSQVPGFGSTLEASSSRWPSFSGTQTSGITSGAPRALRPFLPGCSTKMLRSVPVARRVDSTPRTPGFDQRDVEDRPSSIGSPV